MDNIITISEDIPHHKATFLIGVLVGMGIDYKIDPESPLYRTLRERKRERYHEVEVLRDKETADFQEENYRVILSSGEDIKVKVSLKDAT